MQEEQTALEKMLNPFSGSTVRLLGDQWSGEKAANQYDLCYRETGGI